MRVVVNCNGLWQGGGRGLGLNLLRSLDALETDHEFLVVAPAGAGYEDLALGGQFQTRLEPRRKLNDVWRFYFDQRVLPRLCAEYGADVLLSMGNVGPIRAPCRHVLQFNNSYWVYSGRHYSQIEPSKRLRYAGMSLLFRQILRNVSTLVVQTATMKTRVKQRYGFQGRIEQIGFNVSQEGLLPTGDGSTDLARRLEQYEGRFKFVCVTGYRSHKNLDLLAEAIRILSRDHEETLLFLTVGPNDGYRSRRFLRRIAEPPLSDHIVNLGPVSPGDLPILYNRCDSMVLPTLMESSSLSYPEAMRFGLPIVTSDLDFAHEISGPAAIYVDPWDPADIARGMKRVIVDPELRQTLVRLGRGQHENHVPSWDAIARRYLAILEG